MISNNSSLKDLHLNFDYPWENGGFEETSVHIVQGVLASESLQSCFLARIPRYALTALAEGLASADIGFHAAPAETSVKADVSGRLRLPTGTTRGLQEQAVRRGPQLKKLKLFFSGDQGGADSLAAMLATNITLKELEIIVRSPHIDITTIVKKGLLGNVCLEDLSLSVTHTDTRDLPSGLREEMLSTLESNKTLERFTFNFKSDKTIDCKLGRNRTERQLVEAGGGLERRSCSHIRCFLAGEPLVGKSTLKDSICRGTFESCIDEVRQWVTGDHQSAKPRTKGIEMVHLASKGVNMQFWDLGGQPEYHTIHDLFMPTLGGDMAVPPIFLLLYNPVMECDQLIIGSSSGHNSADEAEKRQQEGFWKGLRYWLRFIATNCKAKRKPSVIFICNPHLTKTQKLSDLKPLAGEVVDWMSKEFHETLDIANEVIVMDVRRNRDAKEVKEIVFGKAKALLHNKSMLKIMERVQTVMIESSRPGIPLMTWAKFRAICWPLTIASQYHEERSRREGKPGQCQSGLDYNVLLKVMASYLHDIGQIIWFEPMPFVVLNPQWFCCKLVGELIPTKFHARGAFNGIANLDLLERVLVEAIPEPREVGVEDVVNLMLRMELAYKECDADPRSSLLIPSCLPNRQDGDKISWKVETSNEHEPKSHYFGYRIECKDKRRTMLTAGFFHRLQVRFHGQFHDKGIYNCKKDLCEIFSNGYEIYVEFGGSHDDWIDVLVSSSKAPPAESAEWVEKNILRTIYELRSEPTGLPGVDLVTKILRPLCVTASLIVPRRYRSDDQTVTEETLIEGMEREEYRYMHSWHAIWDEKGQEIVPRSCDDAMALIRPRTLECHLSIQKNNLNRVCESFGVQEGNSEQIWCEAGCNSSIGDCPDGLFGCEQTPKYAHELADLVTRGFRDVGRKVDRNFRSINEMKEVVNMQRDEQRNAFARICNALSRISVFATDQHTRRLPHRVYITQRTSGSRQKLSFLFGLTSVELHLMCECRDQFHVVDGQKGKELHLQEKERRHAWTLFKWTILAMTVLLKAGCAISMGLCELVPDLGGLAKWTSFVIGAVGDAGLDFVDLEDLEKRMNASGKDMFKDDDQEDGVTPQDAMDWLERILEGGASEIRERFDLRRVRYRDTGSVAWICSSCLKNSQLFVEVF
ncbi:hypothetical protein CBR_g38599 [Chara braunii]|uniref:Uncharacterized protein n=1 Tax=Chara braunii TaxID=69332 RepID=A0A388K0E5_CHABU|nr:hypothetical protein CBR_g38599 [Chara braunii]|eukprot:GBG63531.1 hypothetical protein CBR_g38599 [Chara braunii]